MQKRFETAILAHHMLVPGDTVIAAVSGGADSVCLLRLLLDIAPEWRLRIHVAHLHHQLRGREADADADFVVSLAQQWGCPVHVEWADVQALAACRGKGIEEAGRKARYDFFTSLAGRVGADAVALGHHADDQAETLLLRLLRGSGTTGLAGMTPVRWQADRVKLIRPLLGLQRYEIERFLRSRSISWRQDKSNMQPDYMRNRIRHGLLPYLREHYNPRLSQLLARTAEVLQAEDAYMQDQVDQLLPRKLHDRFGFVTIPRELLVNQPLAIQRRVIRRLLTAADDLGALVVDYEHTTKLLEHILSGSRSWEYPVSANVSVIASQGWLFFLNRQDRKPVDIEVAWTIPSVISIPTLATRLSATRTIRPINGWSGMDCLDVSLEACRLGVRAWRPGDLITLPDGLGRKKLSDLFVDRKIPLPHRHRIPIVTCNDEVVWVVGVMVAGDYRPAADTEAALMLEYDAELVEGGAIL